MLSSIVLSHIVIMIILADDADAVSESRPHKFLNFAADSSSEQSCFVQLES